MTLPGLLAVAVPCQARPNGCSSDNVTGVVLIVLLAAALIFLVSAAIWFHWSRGPFPWLMRIVTKWRRRPPRE
jgi:hypothetical protein